MSRLALFCVLAVAASAQAPSVEYVDQRPDVPTLRVLETTPNAVTVEVTAAWRTPLEEAVERADGQIENLIALASAGRATLSHEISLGSAVPPAVTVLSFEGDEVTLPASMRQAYAVLEDEAAEVVNLGERRRELVGSLSLRTLRVEGDRLIRARRVVVRVPRPPVVARLASSGDDNPHLAVGQSRLAEGRWFKVPIPETGVYRIDADFLRDQLGLEDAISMSSIGVYGTGGRILPAVNAVDRPADLLPVASLEADGGLVFYAEGPSWWDWVSRTGARDGYWLHDISPFSSNSFYFLRLDDPSPSRIGEAAFPGSSGAQVLATIQDRRFYEEDFVNIERDGGGSGLDWLGPTVPLNSASTPRLSVAAPGASAASPVRYRARVVARANPAVTFTMIKGGQSIASGAPSAISTSSQNTGNLANQRELVTETTYGSGLEVEFRATGGGNVEGAWLDWVQAVLDRPAVAEDGFVQFPTPGGETGLFETTTTGFASEPQVWDVTDAGAIRRLGVAPTGQGWRIQVEAATEIQTVTSPTGDVEQREVVVEREVVAFDPAGASVRTPGGLEDGAVAVANQNLHATTVTPDYVVVSHPDFLSQANRLADYRQQKDGLTPLVVTTDQVYNEFAGGTSDMRAVRDYMKFLYDRAPSDRLPQYLLLFGDGHYNFRRIPTSDGTLPGPNYVPTYQSENMLNRTTSYMSDDYFGLLGDEEGEWQFSGAGTDERVDVGIGRIPSRTLTDARNVVNKIISYEDPATDGVWRTRHTYVADDQFPNDWDNDVHVLNSDGTAELAQEVDPRVTIQKIYAPSYPSIVTARGRLRPQATEAVRESIEAGTLIWNYSGHGGPSGLGDEEYLTEDLVASLDNADRLAVFVTATCSFGKFDIVDRQSLAEQMLLKPDGGGVAMLTTVRLVFTDTNPQSNTNFGLNRTLTEKMLLRDAQGLPLRLGDALYLTKNTDIGASTNNRKFNLLGDPAMRLGAPARRIDVNPPPAFRAFDEATITGQVLALDGQPDAAYQGEVVLEVYDAARKVTLPEGACCNTDSRDDDDRLGDYADRSDRIYTGRASVEGGRFSSTFLVPQDVSYSGLAARVVAYATGPDGTDGTGQSTEGVVATDASSRPNDGAGPEISLFVNDSTFVDGGTTNPDGVLFANLRDPSGLNAVGAGVGHELLLVLDGDESNAIDVSRFYQGDLNTYQSGSLRVPLSALARDGRVLEAGEHTATLTAWDALNNVSVATITFVVVDEGVIVRSVLPYPNPTAGPSRFFVEHNQPVGTQAQVQLRIYTVAGRPVRTIDGADALPGGVLTSRTLEVPWDGLDDDLDRLGSGVYLVRLRMEVPNSAGGSRVAERIERLAVIR
ncbi:type IX secretion system sortase PorU [Rubrivirga sp.]|uniref:type IX secretion system sortase PorU n=1 Tax=Rubrivirga sp. TaxID=1885344 RepID=UPI003C71FB95